MTLWIAVLAATGVVLMFSGLMQPGSRPTRRRPLDRLDRLVAEAGYRRITGASLLGLCGVAGVAGSTLGAALTPLPLLALLSGIGGVVLPVVLAQASRERKRNALRHAWPDVLADIISGIRAGLSLAECCSALSRRGPHEMREGFGAFAATYAASGSFDAALTRLQQALADPVADRVVSVLRMAHEVGGNDLVRVLRTSAEFIRDDLRVRGEIRARWSWTVTAARIAAAAPFAVLAIMGVRPDAAAVYASPAGTTTILVGAALCFLGYRLMLRAARLPEERRIT